MNLRNTSCRPAFLLALLLTLGSAFNWQLQYDFMQRQTKTDKLGHLQQFVPERLRSFVAARFWARADELMHRGPYPGSRQAYMAGSYFGNSDIVPLLQVVIALMPEELAPYQLQARCLASLEAGDRGLRVLQHGIINNPDHLALHELYASAAYLKLFSGEKPDSKAIKSAAKYLERASGLFENASLKLSSDPAFNASAYYVLLARIYLELFQPEKSLRVWLKSGLDLDQATDSLAEILRHFRDQGQLPEALFPPFLSASTDSAPDDSSAVEPESESAVPRHLHQHNDGGHSECGLCSDGNNSEMQKTLPGFPLVRLFQAGFMLVLVLLVGRVKIRG